MLPPDEPRGSRLPDIPEPETTIIRRTIEPLLDIKQTSQLLGMTPRMLRKQARQGMIPAIRVGWRWLFRASVVKEWRARAAG